MYYATIAISVFYRPDECLPVVLESILKDPCDHKSLEIFVCDDCSPASRETMQAIVDSYRDKFGKITLLRHDERDGFRKTLLLRHVIEQCDSQLFVFLDGDCVVHNKALSRILRAARTNDALCQGQRVYLWSDSIQWSVMNLKSISDFSVLKTQFLADNTKTRKSKKRHRDSLRAQYSNVPGRFNYASGYLMGLKTEFVRKIGMGLCNTRGHTEDTDFAQRLFDTLGIDVLEVKDAEVLHLFEHH